MPKFVKKPVIITAVKYTGYNHEELIEFAGNNLDSVLAVNKPILINTLEGKMQANVGDWIIQGVKGEFYPCKPDIFEMTYSEARGV